MIRAAALIAALMLAGPSAAQPVSDVPRTSEMFADPLGYEDLADTALYGTPGNPNRDPAGLFLVMRMFHNTCLGLEAGLKLSDAMPPGFSAQEEWQYLFGIERSSDWLVLTPTGDVEADEAQSLPIFFLLPNAEGMSCRLEWNFPPEDVAEHADDMVALLRARLPYRMMLLPASDITMIPDINRSGFLDWDRVCANRFCPTRAMYSMSRAWVSLATTLNITAIEGTRP